MAGVRIRTGAAETFLTRLETVELPAAVQDAVAPLRDVIVMLNAQIDGADQYLSSVAGADPVTRRLMTLPGIGLGVMVALVLARLMRKLFVLLYVIVHW